MFPKFDSSHVQIVLKAPVNSTVEQTLEVLKQIQKDLHDNKEIFFIDHISSVAGWRQSSYP